VIAETLTQRPYRDGAAVPTIGVVLDEAIDHDRLDTLAALTPRELEVLQLISSGLTNAEAASRLNVTVHAIKFHLAAIYSRLGVSNRTEAAVAYLRSTAPARGSGFEAD
jgi:DNA-binding NarL/FixJ family response regulator